MLKRSVILVIILLCLINPVFGDYYADVDIEVQDNGLVEIKGNSNHPFLKEGIYNNLTSKDNGYWILNISTDEIFSRYSYKISMPKHVSINYLGVRDIDSFDDKGNFHISGSVTDKPFNIIIQYRQELFRSSSFLFYGFMLLFLILGISTYFFFKKRKKFKKYSKNKFTEREYIIIKLLQKNKGNMSQIELERKTGIPKASLHRNILGLERKNIVEKNQTGMTNQISLKN